MRGPYITTIHLSSGGEVEIGVKSLLVFCVGITVAAGVYCQWRAVEISLSKASLFAQSDDLIAIGLAYVFLGETTFLNTGLVAGILLCMLPAIGYSVYDSIKKRGG